MKPITVFITAYQSQDYIEECLDSVQNQDYFKDNNYEILLGIDGCEQTLEKIKQIKHKYKNLDIYYFPENKGTYVTSNTLISKAKYEWLLRFDSDDIMEPFMISELIKYTNKYNFIRTTCKYLNNENKTILTGGVVLINKKIFNITGGYINWRCEGDANLLERYINAGFYNNVYICNTPVFKRRTHNKSLTQQKTTGHTSKQRQKNREYTKNK